MGFRQELRRRIEKKRGEIVTLEVKLREAQVYIQALEDTLKFAPLDDDDDEAPPPLAMKELREGSAIARAKEAIQKAGKPLHINDLLVALGGKSDDKDARSALSGSLAAYVRKNEIFTRPAPNTFGLLDVKAPALKAAVPPPFFGLDAARVEAQIEDDDVPF